MTDYQATLLQLLSKELFNKSVDLLGANLDDVLKEARMQAVEQCAFNAIDKNLLTQDELNKWKQASYNDIAQNIRVFHNHNLLHKWMSENEIPYVILKGVASAYYYPNPVYRSMGDVDFLVNKEDIQKAGSVLENQNLKPWDEEHISHIVYRDTGKHYEMHFNLAGTPNGDAGDLVREYTSDIFENAETKKILGNEVVLPSKFHHGLILLLHNCHHLTGEGIGLRHLCDWAVFENSLSDAEFRKLFELKLKKLGLWHFAQILTRVSVKYLGAEEKSWAECDDRIVDDLIEDILVGGNFGKKDHNRSIQQMLISNRGKDGVGHISIIKQFIISSNELIFHYWPSARKNKILIPIGWLCFGGRRVFREMTGKRKKTNINKMVDGAAKRRELYKQFHLYERQI